MYGVEAAIILLACAVVVIGLWSAPFWTRLLARVAGRLWNRFEHASNVIEKHLGIQSNESGPTGASSTRLLRDRNPEQTDIYPEEER